MLCGTMGIVINAEAPKFTDLLVFDQAEIDIEHYIGPMMYNGCLISDHQGRHLKCELLYVSPILC
jgi:hypothetical protein